MASGSWYLAVSSMMGQSSMSTERPFHKGARFVRSGSGSHEPGLAAAASKAAVGTGPPLHPVEPSRPAPSVAASIVYPSLESARAFLESMPLE